MKNEITSFTCRVLIGKPIEAFALYGDKIYQFFSADLHDTGDFKVCYIAPEYHPSPSKLLFSHQDKVRQSSFYISNSDIIATNSH